MRFWRSCTGHQVHGGPAPDSVLRTIHRATLKRHHRARNRRVDHRERAGRAAVPTQHASVAYREQQFEGRTTMADNNYWTKRTDRYSAHTAKPGAFLAACAGAVTVVVPPRLGSTSST